MKSSFKNQRDNLSAAPFDDSFLSTSLEGDFRSQDDSTAA
jgi:hypothetical protein